MLMKRMNKMLLVAALAATTLSVQAEQKKGPAWLSDALFYQIYPSSYMDTDGNGIGDLPGITSKLDYIKSLGVNALWLNPIFESGWFDGGYDVIDFYKVDVDKCPNLSRAYGVSSVPMLIFCPTTGNPTAVTGLYPKEELVKAIEYVFKIK